MTEDIRDAVVLKLRKIKRSQTEQAERLGISDQHLSGLLTGGSQGSVKVWLELLGDVGLELKAVDK